MENIIDNALEIFVEVLSDNTCNNRDKILSNSFSIMVDMIGLEKTIILCQEEIIWDLKYSDINIVNQLAGCEVFKVPDIN